MAAVGSADYTDGRLTEDERVEQHRYDEAIAAGLRPDEARIFAIDTGIDVGQLRKLVAKGATGPQIARILL